MTTEVHIPFTLSSEAAAKMLEETRDSAETVYPVLVYAAPMSSATIISEKRALSAYIEGWREAMKKTSA